MLAIALALTLLLSGGERAGGVAALPQRGVLAPGQSLGGLRVDDSAATVRARWGRGYALCAVCTRTTWLYAYRRGQPAGAAVSFRGGKVTAVFTLGVPRGWRTTKGLALGDPAAKVHDVYGSLPWRRCLGYGAVSIRTGGTISSIYTFGESVYGFALTARSEPVCQ